MTLNAKILAVMSMVIIGLGSMTLLGAEETRQEQIKDQESALQRQIVSVISMAQALHDQAAAGAMSDADAQRQLFAQLNNMRWDDDRGYIFAFDSNLVLHLHPLKPQLVGKSMADEVDGRGKHQYRDMRDVDAKSGSGFTRYVLKMPDGSQKDKVSFSKYFKPWDMHFATGAYFDEINASYRKILISSLVKALIVALLVVGVVWLTMRSIRRSIGGEPDDALAMAKRVAEGDLVGRTEALTYAEGSLLSMLERMRTNLTEVVQQVQHGSQVVSTAARQIASGNDDLSQRTQEQASSLEETAASMEEMTSTVKQSAENASHANQLAASARAQAERGGEVASRASSAMRDIEAASRQITDIVQLIDEVAFQTNLLALNAAVEAARAGDQGRGFAVVATEVRNLAQRSAAAAKDIKTLIHSSVEKVQAGGVLVDESAVALTDIIKSIKQVTDVVAEISAAAQEQSTGIDQVNHAVTQMDEVTQQNAALVEEASAAARAMQDQAADLAEQMRHFRVSDDTPEKREVDAMLAKTKAPLHTAPPVAKKMASSRPVAAGAWQEF